METTGRRISTVLIHMAQGTGSQMGMCSAPASACRCDVSVCVHVSQWCGSVLLHLYAVP